MSSILSSIAAALVILPILGYVAVFTAVKAATGNHRKSFNAAVDFTTFLLIMSVHFLIMTIWGKSFFWLILIILFASCMMFAVIQWKTKGEVTAGKVFKGFWRFNFLLFFLGYIALLVFGLIQRAVIAVNG